MAGACSSFALRGSACCRPGLTRGALLRRQGPSPPLSGRSGGLAGPSSGRGQGSAPPLGSRYGGLPWPSSRPWPGCRAGRPGRAARLSRPGCVPGGACAGGRCVCFALDASEGRARAGRPGKAGRLPCPGRVPGGAGAGDLARAGRPDRTPSSVGLGRVRFPWRTARLRHPGELPTPSGAFAVATTAVLPSRPFRRLPRQTTAAATRPGGRCVCLALSVGEGKASVGRPGKAVRLPRSRRRQGQGERRQTLEGAAAALPWPSPRRCERRRRTGPAPWTQELTPPNGPQPGGCRNIPGLDGPGRPTARGMSQHPRIWRPRAAHNPGDVATSPDLTAQGGPRPGPAAVAAQPSLPPAAPRTVVTGPGPLPEPRLDVGPPGLDRLGPRERARPARLRR